MSLHNLAHHVQSAGRGDDKVLVHMTPGEVKGLQSIAMAHGGSLTINPQTGLPEAGFLSSILPMLAGAGLSMIPGVGPMMAAGIVGGGTALATGDLKKGLMAGIGAYGGAGMASGLSAMGAQGAQGAVANAGAGVADDVALANMQRGNMLGNISPQAQVFGAPNLATTATPNVANMGANLTDDLAMSRAGIGQSYSSISSVPPSPTPTFDKALYQTSAGQVNPTVVSGGGGANPAFNAKFTSPPSTVDVGQVQANRGLTSEARTALEGGKYPYDVVPKAEPISRPFTDAMNQMGRGAKEAFSSTKGLGQLYDAMPTGSVIASGLTLAEALKPEDAKPKESDALIRPYEFSYNPTNVSAEPYSGSAERTYFNPVFTAKEPYKAPGPEYAAQGGLMGLAAGGAVDNPRAVLAQAQQALTSKDPVQHMSEVNALGSNMGYPMANIKAPSYNVSRATPIPTNMVDPMGDTDVDPYTGAERFRSGGAAKEPQTSGGYTYDYNPSTMQFTQTGAPTPTADNGPFNLMARALGAGINNPQPTTPNGTVSGGMVQPVTQPTAPAQPIVPNVNVPAYQTPEQQLGLGGFYDYMNQQLAGYKGFAAGGMSNLGSYSDGGRLLKGPGDGVSDSIPAVIGQRQPARLADGEFVVPARIVSELGNGSTQAGARKLYAMMDRVQNARKKSVGKKKVAVNSRADKYLPA